MARFIIDANLPYYFSIWRGSDYIHVNDVDDGWSDSQLWCYAAEYGLTIVTKDADFSDRVLLTEPPPQVIHVKLGNMKMRGFHRAISSVWEPVCELSSQHRLVRIFADRLEAIE